MNQEEKDRIKRIISEYTHIEESEILDIHNLKDGLGLDSLSQIDMIIRIEQEYNIHVPDYRIEELISVHNVYDLVSDYLKK